MKPASSRNLYFFRYCEVSINCITAAHASANSIIRATGIAAFGINEQLDAISSTGASMHSSTPSAVLFPAVLLSSTNPCTSFNDNVLVLSETGAGVSVSCELLRLIEVGASCFNHYCVGCGVTQLNVLHNVHRRISLG